MAICLNRPQPAKQGYYENKVTDIIIGKNKMNSQKRTEIEIARITKKSLGFKTALRYLVKRDWTIEAVLWILLQTTERA